MIGGSPITGFPLLLSNTGTIVEPALSFLVHHLLHRGSVQSHRSWEAYGYALLDFFEFLERTSRAWDEPRVIGVPSVVAAYRQDALARGLRRSTINLGLHLICRFYQRQLKEGAISALPFDMQAQMIRRDRHRGLAPLRSEQVFVPDVKLRAPRRRLKVLSGSQVRVFLSALTDRTLRLLATFQLSTGLRIEEAVSFPQSLVVDPRLHPSVRHMFPVTLDPHLMTTKGSNARVIHVPRSLMAELWAWAAMERPRRVGTHTRAVLFVTRDGRAYRRNTVWQLYARMGRRHSLEVSPHVLRHTFATHTLAALRRVMNVGNALLYVKERLGHQSVTTTERYLHHVDDVADEVMTSYQTELLEAMEPVP